MPPFLLCASQMSGKRMRLCQIALQEHLRRLISNSSIPQTKLKRSWGVTLLKAPMSSWLLELYLSLLRDLLLFLASPRGQLLSSAKCVNLHDFSSKRRHCICCYACSRISICYLERRHISQKASKLASNWTFRNLEFHSCPRELLKSLCTAMFHSI